MQQPTLSSSLNDLASSRSDLRATTARAGCANSVQEVKNAINRAAAALLAGQAPEGCWCGELIVDATLCADLIFHAWWSGRRDPELERKCRRHIETRQAPGGGWAIYEGGPAELNATLKCLLALRMAGVEAESPAARRASAIITDLGGVHAANTYAKFWLALLGLIGWDALPAIPPEIVLFPQVLPFHLGRLSAWSRVILVPMSVIRHHRPAPAVKPPFGIEELFAAKHAPRRKVRIAQWPFLAADFFIKLAETWGLTPWRATALAAAEAWMIERMQEGSDGLGAVFPSMLNALIALQTLGYPSEHPLFVKGLADFEGLFVDDPQEFRVQPCLSPAWDTAIAANALSGCESAEAAEAVARACHWLRTKEVRFAGDWAVENHGVQPSGWAFEFNNKYYPDIDDTAMVLIALARGGDALSGDDTVQMERAFRWILALQCADGGWAAFDRDVTEVWLENVPFADHNAILDPSCSDVTARVLEAMGAAGWHDDSRRVRAAVAYLQSTQTREGCWYGRWGVNYIYGTWQTLCGLRAVGWDMTEAWVQRAAAWLRARQNADGGWGESPLSYEDPRQVGVGPSTPSQTAWALMGLIAAGHGLDASVRKGVDHLVESQREDGWWDEPATTGTGFPRVFYLKYDLYRLVWPLAALSQAAALLEQVYLSTDFADDRRFKTSV